VFVKREVPSITEVPAPIGVGGHVRCSRARLTTPESLGPLGNPSAGSGGSYFDPIAVGLDETLFNDPSREAKSLARPRHPHHRPHHHRSVATSDARYRGHCNERDSP
jgi:hypothetical protein